MDACSSMLGDCANVQGTWGTEREGRPLESHRSSQSGGSGYPALAMKVLRGRFLQPVIQIHSDATSAWKLTREIVTWYSGLKPFPKLSHCASQPRTLRSGRGPAAVVLASRALGMGILTQSWENGSEVSGRQLITSTTVPLFPPLHCSTHYRWWMRELVPQTLVLAVGSLSLPSLRSLVYKN